MHCDFSPSLRPPLQEVIVSVEWLKELLRAKPLNPSKPVVINGTWSEDGHAHEFIAGRVPGSILLHTDRLETGYPRWALRSLPELQAVIGELGIADTEHTVIVVYGERTIAAARVWWTLMYSGVRDVRYLDGGLGAWRAAGLPVESGLPVERVVLSPQQCFSAVPRNDFIISTQELLQRLYEPELQIADTRHSAEFHGVSSGYDYVAFAGRLPSAISVGDADDRTMVYQDTEGRLRDPSEILGYWLELGLTPDTHEVVFYCGTGWRSSLAYLYAYALGFVRVRNYSDGWVGWSTRYKPAVPDVEAAQSTPGWSQIASGNPIEPMATKGYLD